MSPRVQPFVMPRSGFGVSWVCCLPKPVAINIKQKQYSINRSRAEYDRNRNGFTGIWMIECGTIVWQSQYVYRAAFETFWLIFAMRQPFNSLSCIVNDFLLSVSVTVGNEQDFI